MTEPSPINLALVSEELDASQSLRRSRSPLSWYNLGFFSDLLYLILVIGISLWLDGVEPFQRPIDKLVLNDPDLSHPHLDNIVTSTMLWIYAVVIPVSVGALFFCVSWALRRLNNYDAAFSFHLYILSLLLALAITGLVTNIFKYLYFL